MKNYLPNLEASKFLEHMQTGDTPRKFSLLIEAYRIHPKSVADWPLNFADPDLLLYFNPKAMFFFLHGWNTVCRKRLRMFQDKDISYNYAGWCGPFSQTTTSRIMTFAYLSEVVNAVASAAGTCLIVVWTKVEDIPSEHD